MKQCSSEVIYYYFSFLNNPQYFCFLFTQTVVKEQKQMLVVFTAELWTV